MGGHLANIGFGGDQWQPAVMEASSKSRLCGKSDRGLEHYLWRDPSGARVVYHAKGGELLCLTPGYRPSMPTAWEVETSAPLEDLDCLDCSGADLDILDGRGELVTRAALQFELFAPWHAWLRVKRRFRMEVAGFVHWASACRDEKALNEACAARGIGDLKLASTAFLPVGLFGEAKKGVTERSTAVLTGRIDAVQRRVNGHTGTEFVTLRIATLPGSLDLAGDPETFNGDLEPGRIILAEVWLTGRPDAPLMGWELT